MEAVDEVELDVDEAWEVRSATPGRLSCTRSTVDSWEGGSEVSLRTPASGTAEGDVSLSTPLGPCRLGFLGRLSLVEAGEGAESLRDGAWVSAGWSVPPSGVEERMAGTDSLRESSESRLSWSVS